VEPGQVNFTVEDRYTQAPGSEWVGRAAPHSGCAYVVETQVHKAEGAGTEGEVFIALRGERAAGRFLPIHPLFATGSYRTGLHVVSPVPLTWLFGLPSHGNEV
jgi:hypothetical protein